MIRTLQLEIDDGEYRHGIYSCLEYKPHVGENCFGQQAGAGTRRAAEIKERKAIFAANAGTDVDTVYRGSPIDTPRNNS
jgi:hypothetical protein